MTPMNIERNSDINKVLNKIAEAKKDFYAFTRGLNDEELEAMCTSIHQKINECIVNLAELDTFLFTTDVIAWGEGDTVASIAKARV